jgi:phosphatidylglycerophosphatase A
MKTPVEKRKPSGIVDYIALALTTFGVGYGPIAPGTWGSMVGVAIYLGVAWFETSAPTSGIGAGLGSLIFTLFYHFANSSHFVLNAVLLPVFCLVGIWASGRTAPIFGNSDPSQAVVDEVMGQLITFCFIPFGLGWPFILAGFLLFRLFDIWKPFPVRNLEVLPGGLGICADDIVAGVYAGICLAVVYAVFLAV